MISPQMPAAALQVRIAPADGAVQRDREASRPRVVLLFTRDRELDHLVAEALLGSSATVLIARDVSDALQIVCGRGRDLQLAVLDLDGECRGMALLSAMHTCDSELPVLITAAPREERFRTLAFANGASACLNKPIPLTALAAAIAALSAARAAGHSL